MPVDYSKWDALELSDDSDIEVHPNVDKRSFIRAKQTQIHQERAQRRHQILTLKYERIINDGLLERIDRLLTALKSHRSGSSAAADELVFQALIESAGDASTDQAPAPPEGVHTNAKGSQPTYSKMMAALVDQVKREVDESKTNDRFEGFITGIDQHRSKVDGLQKELLAKLDELEREDKRHITSDDIHTGFDVSHVSKNREAEQSTKRGEVELLNPSFGRADTGQSSGADADVEDGLGVDDDDENMEPTKLGRDFAKIRAGDYRACLQFLSEHPSILTERESDGLLVEGFNSQMEGKEAYARQCVHQALMIQYCRQLGKDGVALFFKRITTKDHQANKLFLDDVNSTYAKIKSRAGELASQKTAESQGEEQIQLHAVDPNTTINIIVPPPIPTDLSARSTQPPPTEEQVAARGIFESFPPGLQRALESGSLDEVNVVLGKMSVDEAEEVVTKLGEGGILSLEQGVVDATTEEGKKLVQEIERTGKMPAAQIGDIEELSEDPPLD